MIYLLNMVISGEMEWQRALNAAQEVGFECSDDPQLCWQNRQVLFGSSKPIQAAYAQKNCRNGCCFSF